MNFMKHFKGGGNYKRLGTSDLILTRVMRVTYLGGETLQTDRQTDLDRPIMCSSLALERKERLIIIERYVVR